MSFDAKGDGGGMGGGLRLNNIKKKCLEVSA